MIPFWEHQDRAGLAACGHTRTLSSADRHQGQERNWAFTPLCPRKGQARDGADRRALSTGDRGHCGFFKSADEFWYQMTAPGTRRGFSESLSY